MESRKKAILVVSFGTSYEETRKKTIDRIEADMQKTYPEYALYRAWTSNMIRRKLLKRDGIRILDVSEALEQMRRDGISEVIVQPTHVISGIENERMTEAAEAFRDKFDRIAIGRALVSSAEDSCRVIQTVVGELQTAEDEALVLMGHGTEHDANAVYEALDDQFKAMGYSNIFMGTVEGSPTLEAVKRMVEKTGLKKLVLAPFMVVAGDHATNDLAGDGADSWKSVFERAGYEVRCVRKGLGEYAGIRNLFLDHAAAVME